VSGASARLTPLETLWSVPVGFDATVAPLAVEHRGPVPTPRQALEHAVLAALRRPPCLVSFSGGVDSSVVLALAAHVARREGLSPPIPATHRFPAVAEADEAGWQERVVAHLGLADWLRLEWTDELDLVGPVAARLLRRHGPLVPFNGHFQLPFVERAAGGALLTGVGGDELFAPLHRATAAHVLHRHRAPRPRDLPALAFGAAPRRLRAEVVARRRGFERYGWIRPHVRRRLARAYGAWEAAEPLGWDRALRDWWWRSRALQCNLAGKRALGTAAGVLVESPFAAPAVLVACAAAGGAVGLGSRASALERIAGELLPPGLLARSSKASFDGAFWTSHARAFAAAWDGAGVDAACVDVAALRAEWARPRPDPHSFALLQQAWLAAGD
jgi:asparagine synthetase B (glutamine-hydrolysing)